MHLGECVTTMSASNVHEFRSNVRLNTCEMIVRDNVQNVLRHLMFNEDTTRVDVERSVKDCLITLNSTHPHMTCSVGSCSDPLVMAAFPGDMLVKIEDDASMTDNTDKSFNGHQLQRLQYIFKTTRECRGYVHMPKTFCCVPGDALIDDASNRIAAIVTSVNDDAWITSLCMYPKPRFLNLSVDIDVRIDDQIGKKFVDTRSVRVTTMPTYHVEHIS